MYVRVRDMGKSRRAGESKVGKKERVKQAVGGSGADGVETQAIHPPVSWEL